MTTFEQVMNNMNVLAIHDNDKFQHFQPNYDHYSTASSDNTSDITIKNGLIHDNSNEWLVHEMEHSFQPNKVTVTKDDYYDHHDSIIQSYLEPVPTKHTIYINEKKTKNKSKFSFLRRIFGCEQTEKELPVLPTKSKKWTPSICSSTTTANSTTDRRRSNFVHRNSCGIISTKYHDDQIKSKKKQSKKMKGILKKPTGTMNYQPYYIPPERPRTNRFSIMNSPRYSVIHMMKKKQRKSKELFTEEGKIKFHKYVSVHETYTRDEYDRSSDPDAVCTRLTAVLAQQIKQELNHYKLHEMQVHDSSRIHTHFFL